MRVLAIALLTATFGCVDDDDGSPPDSTEPATSDPAPLSLDDGAVAETATEFTISVSGGGCVVDDEIVQAVEVDRVDVAETADAITLTGWTVGTDDPRLPGEGESCLDVATGLPEPITLDAPLGERPIVDGFCSTEIVIERVGGDDEGRCSEENQVLQPAPG